MAEPRILVLSGFMLGASYDVYRLVKAGMKLAPVPAHYNRNFNRLMRFWFGSWW
jgi:hypothetical protein